MGVPLKITRIGLHGQVEPGGGGGAKNFWGSGDGAERSWRNSHKNYQMGWKGEEGVFQKIAEKDHGWRGGLGTKRLVAKTDVRCRGGV